MRSEMDAEHFPNFVMLEEEMIARRLVGRFDDIDWQRLYLEMTELAELSLELGVLGECLICFERKRITNRPCCGLSVCKDCLKSYYTSLVSNAIVKIQCIGYSCNEYVSHEELVLHLDDQTRQRFRQFLVDANKNPNQKTCPRCNHITDLDEKAQADAGGRKSGIQVTCPECQLVWCFRCQGPWHEALTCKDYQRGDLLFKSWTKRRQNDQVNAQMCPKCKVYIQRSSGCDHMTCNRCSTNFCYQCGEKYRSLKFIGNHQSRLSIFGCKYRFKPEDPVKRRLIRGSIFGGKLLAAPVIGGLALGAGAVVLGIGLVALPFYGGYRLHKLARRRKREKALKLNRELWAAQMRRSGNREFWEEREITGQDERLSTPESASVPDVVLYDIVEESDAEAELDSDEDTEYYFYCCDKEHSDVDWTHDEDNLESHLDVCCDDNVRDKAGCDDNGKSSFVTGPNDPDCISFGALNSSYDSSDDAFQADGAFGLKDAGPDAMPDVLFMVKCSQVENGEIESAGSAAEAALGVDANLPKLQRCKVPVLVRRHGTRCRSRLFESENPGENSSDVTVLKTFGKSNASDLSDPIVPKRSDEYVAPCDMVTHL